MERKDEIQVSAKRLKICHTADIHVRGHQRHEEYRKALGEFIDKCRYENPDAIALVGDIWHTKTHGITPESTSLLRWFFFELSRISKTFVVLGNHDENRLNTSAIDALSPIIDAINDHNLILCDEPGVYRIIDGYNFNVVVEKDGSLHFPEYESSDISIALFHGSIKGSLTDEGWSLDGSKLSDFDKFDFTLLGDIHKRQFLGGSKRVAYPGSLIPQNFSETDEKGFLVWSINDRTDFDVSFRPLTKYIPFITLHWPGQLEKLKSDIDYVQQLSRFRIVSDSDQSVPHKEIAQYLYDKKIADEVVFKREKHKNDDKQIENNHESLDETTVQSVINRVGQYFSLILSDISVETISALVSDYVANITADERNGESLIWSLSSLRFDNTFSYGDGNIIDFSKLNGLVGIFAPNRMGKSSIIGTLLYALQNVADRCSLRPVDIINSDSQQCSACVKLIVGTRSYIIERNSKRNKQNQLSAATTVQFYEESATTNLNNIQRKDTDREIRKITGSASDIMLTSISTQFDIAAFIDGGGSQRKATIARHFGLDHYERLYSVVHADVEKYKVAAAAYETTPWLALIDAESQIFIEQNELAENTRAKIIKLTEKRDTFRESLIRLMSSKTIDQTTIERLRNSRDEIKVEIDMINVKLSSENKQLERLKRDVVTNEERIRVLNIDGLRAKLVVEKKIESQLAQARHEHDKLSAELRELRQAASLLNTVPCGDMFPRCPFISDASAKKQLIKQYELATQELNDNVLKISLELSEHVGKNTQKLLAEAELMPAKLSDSIRDVALKEAELAPICGLFAEREGACIAIQQKLSETISYSIMKVDAQARIEHLKKRIDELQVDIQELNDDLLESASKARSAEFNIARFTAEKNIKLAQFNEWKKRAALMGAFSKHGIPEMLISQKLSTINTEIALMLGSSYGFSVIMEKNNKSGDIDVIINDHSGQRKIESCCGMERVVSSLAIRTALTRVSSLPRSDIFMVDEGFGALDEQSLDKCKALLRSITEHFRAVVIVTHVEQMKDYVDTIIDITKGEDGRSYIKFT